jgi:hypothetical protein
MWFGNLTPEFLNLNFENHRVHTWNQLQWFIFGIISAPHYHEKRFPLSARQKPSPGKSSQNSTTSSRESGINTTNYYQDPSSLCLETAPVICHQNLRIHCQDFFLTHWVHARNKFNKKKINPIDYMSGTNSSYSISFCRLNQYKENSQIFIWFVIKTKNILPHRPCAEKQTSHL